MQFCTASPRVGAEWTDDGACREVRQLKGRGEGEWRRVRVAPRTPGFAVPRETIGASPNGRVFCGVRGGELATVTYRRVWDRAHLSVLPDVEYASPLAKCPYDLRHACVSTWLNGGLPATQVAEWAGHSVEVLLRVYAKCIEGQDEMAKRRIEKALRGS